MFLKRYKTVSETDQRENRTEQIQKQIQRERVNPFPVLKD